jgi:para-nitrobenzyl esterase
MSAMAFSDSRIRLAPQRSACALVLILGCSVACGGDDAPAQPMTQPDASTADSGAGADASQADSGRAVDGLLVKLKDGEVQGDMDGAARLFRKIPFAKPPLGPLRWKAPVPNDAWQGVRHETEFAQGCAQLADQGAPASPNEDCLYLNVWSPEPAPDKAPVMLWIHGGGNFSGGAGIPIPTTNQLWYDGHVFAERHGIVLVTIQYRLGPLGFFAHPALADESQPVGNQGLLDQRLALQWVRDNIAKFGGDPGKVTIFGESAGSADVCYHMASPGSRGLFHRAISESGGCTIRSVGPERAIQDIGAQMVAYAEAVGCKAGKDQLGCLRAAPIEDLLANGMQPMPGAGEVSGGAKWSFAAVLDGPKGFLPDTLQALFDRGEIADVPYLLGSNNDEGATFVIRATPLMNQDEYMADLTQRYGDAAASVAEAYPPSAFDGNFNLARARVIGDSGVVCSTHDTARRAAKAGRKVFMYNFNVPWSIAPDALHAGHAGEISHVFGTPWLPMPDAASERVGEGMNAYWARFAATGDPNGSGAPAQWPQFKVDDDKRLQLDADWKVVENFRNAECAFWRKYNGAE